MWVRGEETKFRLSAGIEELECVAGTRPSYDTKDGIETWLSSLGGLNQLIGERRTAGYDRDECLREFVLLGRYYSDSCGNTGKISIALNGRMVSPKDADPAIPDVLTSEEFNEYLQAEFGEEAGGYSRGMHASLPPPNVPCPCCSCLWTLEDCHEAQEIPDREVMRLDDFVGKTFAEFKRALALKTDAVYFVQSDLPIRNDRFIDLNPNPKYPDSKINEDGWLRKLDEGDAYVIQPGDESFVNVRRYYHPGCYAETLRKTIEERFNKIHEQGDADSGEETSKGNHNLNLAGQHSDVATACCRQELSQAGIPAVDVDPEGEVQSKAAGLLEYTNGTRVLFVRAWYYWVVRCSAPLPSKPATRLNRKLGEVVRVNGFAGGMRVPRTGVDAWHVDTDLGLCELVKALDEQFGERAGR